MTIEQLLFAWLNHRKTQGRLEVCNHDMAEAQLWARRNYDVIHNAASYERIFRIIKGDNPGLFEDVSDQYPDQPYKTWKLTSNFHSNGSEVRSDTVT